MHRCTPLLVWDREELLLTQKLWEPLLIVRETGDGTDNLTRILGAIVSKPRNKALNL